MKGRRERERERGESSSLVLDNRVRFFFAKERKIENPLPTLYRVLYGKVRGVETVGCGQEVPTCYINLLWIVPTFGVLVNFLP